MANRRAVTSKRAIGTSLNDMPTEVLVAIFQPHFSPFARRTTIALVCRRFLEVVDSLVRHLRVVPTPFRSLHLCDSIARRAPYLRSIDLTGLCYTTTSAAHVVATALSQCSRLDSVRLTPVVFGSEPFQLSLLTQVRCLALCENLIHRPELRFRYQLQMQPENQDTLQLGWYALTSHYKRMSDNVVSLVVANTAATRVVVHSFLHTLMPHSSRYALVLDNPNDDDDDDDDKLDEHESSSASSSLSISDVMGFGKNDNDGDDDADDDDGMHSLKRSAHRTSSFHRHLVTSRPKRHATAVAASSADGDLQALANILRHDDDDRQTQTTPTTSDSTPDVYPLDEIPERFLDSTKKNPSVLLEDSFRGANHRRYSNRSLFSGLDTDQLRGMTALRELDLFDTRLLAPITIIAMAACYSAPELTSLVLPFGSCLNFMNETSHVRYHRSPTPQPFGRGITHLHIPLVECESSFGVLGLDWAFPALRVLSVLKPVLPDEHIAVPSASPSWIQILCGLRAMANHPPLEQICIDSERRNQLLLRHVETKPNAVFNMPTLSIFSLPHGPFPLSLDRCWMTYKEATVFATDPARRGSPPLSLQCKINRASVAPMLCTFTALRELELCITSNSSTTGAGRVQHVDVQQLRALHSLTLHKRTTAMLVIPIIPSVETTTQLRTCKLTGPFANEDLTTVIKFLCALPTHVVDRVLIDSEDYEPDMDRSVHHSVWCEADVAVPINGPLCFQSNRPLHMVAKHAPLLITCTGWLALVEPLCYRACRDPGWHNSVDTMSLDYIRSARVTERFSVPPHTNECLNMLIIDHMMWNRLHTLDLTETTYHSPCDVLYLINTLAKTAKTLSTTTTSTGTANAHARKTLRRVLVNSATYLCICRDERALAYTKMLERSYGIVVQSNWLENRPFL